jgi:nucleoside 2-deoxyribosyltransferase
MRHGSDAEPGSAGWAGQLFEMDTAEIKKADLVAALYYGSNSDSGTAWECGYAYSIGKPVVVVHVDRNADSNIMVHCGCTTNIYLEDLADYDFDEMPVYKFEGKMF